MIKVVKGGQQYLTNMTPEELNFIKKELTLDNPTYAQVKAFSRYNYTSVPKYLFFFDKVTGGLIVPRGYKIPFEHEIIEDNRREVKTLYNKFKLELRTAQKEAYEAWKENPDNGMLILPTGKGKSILGCYLAYTTKQKTLVVVQKNDLIDGWRKDFELCFGRDKVGIIKAKKFKIGSQITLTTIQTLSKLPVETKMRLYRTFGMVILDETHHAVAKSYELFKFFQAKYIVGLTATDEIKNLRQALYWTIGDVGYRCPDTVEDEDIMPYTVKLRPSKLKYNPPQMYYYGNSVVDEETKDKIQSSPAYQNSIKKKYFKRKPLDPQELKRLLKDPTFNEMVAKDIKSEYEARKSCIAFLHEKEHIRYLNDLLVAQGVPQSQIQLYYGDSTTPDSIMKEKAESKEVLITLATFSKATEGTNVKSWERAFLVTSIADVKNTKQAVGRIRRRKEGKEDAVVYDYYHPDVVGMRNHVEVRKKAYIANKAKIIGNSQNSSFKGISSNKRPFAIGFNHI